MRVSAPPIINPISSTPRPLTGRISLSRPSLSAPKRSEISINSSRSCEITTTAAPPLGQIDQGLPDRCRRRRIHAPGGLIDHEDARGLQHLAADDEFLQVAAGQRPCGRIRSRRAHVERGDDAAGKRLRSPPLDYAALNQVFTLRACEKGILREAHLRGCGMAEPLFRRGA